jgi:DNA-binding transcriptional ArsR family regulator
MSIGAIKAALFGTDPRKLFRKESPDTSVNAACAIDTTKMEKLVYEKICQYGDDGCIADDLLRDLFGYPYSSVTARFRALLDKGFIELTGEKRKGRSGRPQRVMRRVAQ